MKVTLHDDAGDALSGRVIGLPIKFLGSLREHLAQLAGEQGQMYRVEVEDEEEYFRFYSPYEPYCVIYVAFSETFCFFGTGRIE